MPTDTPYLKGGELNAALASAIVGIHTNHLGRGPTSSSAFHHDDVVAVIMRDVMTAVEKTLCRTGKADAVKDMRRLYQQSMEADAATYNEAEDSVMVKFLGFGALQGMLKRREANLTGQPT